MTKNSQRDFQQKKFLLVSFVYLRNERSCSGEMWHDESMEGALHAQVWTTRASPHGNPNFSKKSVSVKLILCGEGGGGYMCLHIHVYVYIYVYVCV